MLSPGYITLQEAIEATPLSYLANRALLPNLLQILLLFLTVLFDPYILKKQRRIMFAIIALELSLIGQDLISSYLNMHDLPALLRTIQSIYGYSARPIVVLLFFYIIEPDRSYKLFRGLAVANAVVYLTALFSPAAFYITEDNHFTRGPLGYTSHVVSGIMIAYLLYLILREAKRTRSPMTLIPILSVLFIIGAVALDSKIDATKDGLSYLTISIVSCSLFSYIWLHLKFVREHEDALMMEQRVQIMLTKIRPQNVSAAYLRTLQKDLADTFAAAGCADVLINAWQRRGIRTDLVDCDYYVWKKGKPWAINAYRGEYMIQYNWAEITHGALENPEKI